MILVGQGIGFVIMAPAASESHAQKCGRGGLGQIRFNRRPGTVFLSKQFGGIVLGAHAEIPGGDQPVLPGLICRSPRHQFISRELFADKLIERFVVVEGADHVIPVTPGRGPEFIPVIAIAVTVAHGIQPHPRPMDPVIRGVEEGINQAFIGPRSVVLTKFRQNPFFRRQARENIGQAPRESAAVRCGCRGQPGGFETPQDKTVHRMMSPILTGDGGQR